MFHLKRNIFKVVQCYAPTKRCVCHNMKKIKGRFLMYHGQSLFVFEVRDHWAVWNLYCTSYKCFCWILLHWTMVDKQSIRHRVTEFGGYIHSTAVVPRNRKEAVSWINKKVDRKESKVKACKTVAVRMSYSVWVRRWSWMRWRPDHKRQSRKAFQW